MTADELLDALADRLGDRIAERVAARIAAPPKLESPVMSLEEGMQFVGWKRKRLVDATRGKACRRDIDGRVSFDREEFLKWAQPRLMYRRTRRAA